MSKKIINITAAAMALAVTLSGCATAVVQERKDQAAAVASAEAAQAAATATPEPTAEPTPEPINAWSLLSNLPDFTPGTLDNPDTTWPDGLTMTAASSIRCAALIPARHWISRTLHYRMYGICL